MDLSEALKVFWSWIVVVFKSIAKSRVPRIKPTPTFALCLMVFMASRLQESNVLQSKQIAIEKKRDERQKKELVMTWVQEWIELNRQPKVAFVLMHSRQFDEEKMNRIVQLEDVEISGCQISGTDLFSSIKEVLNFMDGKLSALNEGICDEDFFRKNFEECFAAFASDFRQFHIAFRRKYGRKRGWNFLYPDAELFPIVGQHGTKASR